MQADFWNGRRAPGVPDHLEASEFASITELFEDSCRKFANRPAYWNIGVTISYRQLDQLSKDFAAWLQNRTDLKPGDRIAIQMPNMIQFPIAVFGALRAGLVITPTNPLYTAAEMRHQFKDSGAKALVFMNTFGHSVEQVLKETEIEQLIVAELGDMQPSFFKRTALNFAVKHVKKLVKPYNLPQAVSFRDVLSAGENLPFTPVKNTENDIAILQYTGGTTGVAKGAMLSHGNLLANMQQMKAMTSQLDQHGKPLQIPGEESAICPLPLYHIFAFTVHCLCMTAMGNKNILVTNPRDTSMFIKIMSRHKFTGISGVNTLYISLLNHPDIHKVDFSHLRLALAGGMALSRDTSIRFHQLTGAEIVEGYGLTECAPIVSCNPLGDFCQRGTVGLPAPGTELKVIDEDGKILELGERGELCVRGPQVMKGYWNRPEATAEVIDSESWLHTGDVGVIDHDGYIRIVDRIKDIIIVSGFNVYPNEIEDLVNRHPKVVCSAAVGVNDDLTGEAVQLFVQSQDASLTEAELKTWCASELTGYKRPKKIKIVDELPMTPVGKVLRRLLRE
ncbi:AMP-binding protein [Pelagibaculum spongiae]|uniref:Long-chain-fatty-acid--CoA ligase n=1 Tax=Pelagibaculum spongiae TaxID=2080658 RepID=A0A2V1GW99_9GAMM|nr:AMP-binding protein [Pelagibaculum spongiae]PVZ70685.1 long-chain fatty acid--CoA ligase [Pelagibaculum spongiae]